MRLSVDEYNKYEKDGMSKLSNRFLEAFQPDVFLNTGFPTRINKDADIMRFIDSMHDGRLRLYWEEYGFTLDKDEFETVKNISERIYELSKTTFGKGITVKAPLVASVHMDAVMIEPIRRKWGDKVRVFEIGGGCGSFGSIMRNKGVSYGSTDITQAFYLTQNFIWEGLFPESVAEFTCQDINDYSWNDNQIAHYPWWKLWEMRDGNLRADIIVANHCLAEINEMSLRFYLKWSKTIFADSKLGLVIAQNPGSLRWTPFAKVLKMFEKNGYSVVFSDPRYIVFRLCEKNTMLTSKNNEEWLDLYSNKKKLDFTDYCDSNDDVAIELDELGHDRESRNMIGMEDVMDYFGKYKDMDSPDEEFIHYLGIEYL